MTSANEWLFYSTAAWNIDQAEYIAKMLIDNPPDNRIHSSRVVWSSAYKYSIISYCSPFMRFKTSGGKKREEGLSSDIVPLDLKSIHTNIIVYRDQILAHTDIAHLRAVDYEEGFRIASSSAHLSPPPIRESLRLFVTVGEIIIQKLNTLNKNAN